MEGAEQTPDGGLRLPIYHWNTGSIIGHQTRSLERKIRYVALAEGQHVCMKEAAPLALYPGADHPCDSIIVCEGPTDAIEMRRYTDFDTSLIAGCWSATTIPCQEWWDMCLSTYPGAVIISIGDGDTPGKKFNQLVANMARVAYPVVMPPGEDARSVLQREGVARLLGMINRAISLEPLRRRKPPNQKPRREYRRLDDVDIISLVEASGAVRAGSAGQGQVKYRCGLHEDRSNPSLSVDPRTGQWKCWAGCGKGGPIQFVMAWRRLSYEDARCFLEARYV